MRDIHAIFVTY